VVILFILAGDWCRCYRCCPIVLRIVAVVPRTAKVAAAGWSLVLVKLMPGGAQSLWSSVLVELITIDTVMRVMNAAVAPLALLLS
jgi:hypothetical protein